MNELQAYVDSLPSMLLEEEKKKLVKQWKIDNKWGEKKPEPVGAGTVLKAEEVEETEVEDFKPFDLAKIQDGVKSASAPSVEQALEPTESTLEDGSLESPKNKKENPYKLGMTDEELDKVREIATMSSWDSIKNTLINTGNQIKGVADFWGLTSIPGTPMSEQEDTNPALDIATNTVYSAIFGQENVDKFVNWAGEDNFFTEGLGSKSTVKDVERLKEKQAQSLPTKGIIESFEKGDAGGVIAGGINAVSSVIGSLAVNTGTAGTGFFMDYTADNYISYNEQKAENLGVSLDELITSGKADTAAPIGMAAISQGLEVFALGKILKSTKGAARGETKASGVVKKLNKYLGDKLIYNKGARTTVSALSTSATEFNTEILQHAADKVNEEFGRVAGTDNVAEVGKVFVDAVTSKEGLEAGIQGAFGASSIVTGGYSVNAVQTLRGVAGTVDVEQAIDNLTDLRNKQREVDDTVVKQGIQIEIDNVESKISDAVNKGNKLYNNLEDGDISKLESLSDLQDASSFKVTELNKKLRTGKITQESYDIAVSGFKSEFKKARFEINKIATAAEIKAKTAKVEEGAKVIAEQIGTGFETFENEADVASAIETLKEQGGNIDTKSSEDYGTFVVMPDGKRIIILNKESAAQDNVMTTAEHEAGHAVLFETVKNKPEAAIALGTSLLEELKNSKDITFTNSRFLDRFNQYVEDADISKADTMEEVLTLASEGLSNGDIVFNEKATTKIGDFIRRALSAMGLNVKFKTGKDVLNFVRDYNRSVQKGKGLSKGLEKAATKGAKVDIKAPTDIEAEATDIVAKESKKDTGIQASTKVQEIYDTQGEAGAFDIIDQFKPIVSRIVEKRSEAPNFDRQLLTDEIETGKRGILDLVREYKPESGVPLAAYINKFLPARAIEASQRVLGETFTEDVTEAKGVMAEEVETEVTEKPVTRKIKPSSFISNDAVTKIKEQVQEKIKGIDPKNLTFKKLGDLAPEIIAAEIGIPVKKLTSPTANLSKGDATAIQQFVNKNADRLLKILPEGAVVEAATEKLLGISTGVPKGLLNAFYTKQARLGKGAGLAPFKLNKGISKADFLEVFGIVEGKKAEGFDARSPQAQALKGIASLYGKLVTNEIVRSDTDLSLEAKQDVAAGKNKAMASKRLLAEANIKPGLVDEFLKATSSKGFNDILEAKLKDESIKQPWKSAATEYFKENPIKGLDTPAAKQVIKEVSNVFSMQREEVAVKRFSDRSFKEIKNIIDESLASDLTKGYDFNTVDLVVGDKIYRADEFSLGGLNKLRTAFKILADEMIKKGYTKQQLKSMFFGPFAKPANIGGFLIGTKPNSFVLEKENIGKIKTNSQGTRKSRGAIMTGVPDLMENFLSEAPDGPAIPLRSDTYQKNWWTNPKGVFNRKTQKQKFEFIEELYEQGNKTKKELIDLVDIISELEIDPASKRFLVTQLFADMAAIGKRASGTRYVLTDVDGNMFSFKELENLGLTRPGGDKGVFEHTKPANRVAVAAYAYARAGDAKTKQEFLNELETFDSALITEQMDDMLRNLKLQSKMGLDYKSTSNPMVTRYREMVSELSEQGVFFYDIKTKKQITPLEVLSDGLVELEADDVQSIKEYKEDVKVKSELVPGKVMASKRDSDLIPDAIKYDRPITVQTAINALEKTDKSLELARKLDQPVKKIRVFDFDDTLARSKSMVIVVNPDGTTKKINATQFAQQAADLESQGVEFDFSEFSKVVEGKKGPLFEVAKIIADKRGTEDVFILTARPQNADGPIKAFMKANGIDIPLKNITGLGDGTAEAKAGWIMGKAAEGYNDFYFADDAIKNVKAVKDVLSQIDVKSKVQLAKASKRQTFDTIVNDMIEDSSGIETYKNYSAARAQTIGANKGKFNFFIPPSAEDFTGLLYKMLGKGKKGDAQMAFLKANLLDPYDRAESAVTQAKISAANDFKALKTELKTLPTSLSVPTGIGGFTYSHAVRTAIWTAQGMDIPGLSKKDIKELNDFVQNDPELRVFANELIKIQKGKPYPKPGKDWLGGNITSDIINDINKVNRAEYQQEWRENVDIIFSEDNMNKMEAAYGTRWREAMEDSLRRMKSGSNRPPGGNRATDGILDWLNNSVGAVMFLNTRSALLQTISAVNFINWGDNNIVKAGAAFANQKQFWSDFMTLMNSDYLVERRNGLKINVSESEIADAVRDSKNKVKSAIAFLLSKGFVMTRFADSFAIATGGSTFYRNRVKALLAKGMEQKAAEAQAFSDFRQIAEESQQSSNPNRISAQQASAAGRVILAWANTPMQYARIQKRSAQDLINGRGDWKTNVSKIVYYGAVQNLIFNSLQQAVFALGFGEDDEEKDAKKNEKISRVANGMIDSQLKGLGIGGAAVLALKSTLMELGKQHAKKRPEYDEAVFDLLNFSPPLGSKVNKIRGGLRSFSWNKKEMKEKGFSLDNPSYLAGAQVVTGLTNIPLDRVAKKINNVRGIVNEESALWQKVALGLGWSTWDLGLGYYGGFDAARVLTAEEEKVKEIDDMKKLTKTKEQVDMLLDLGLSKKEIKALGKEQNRVEKIIELQNAEAEPKKEAEVKEEIKEETKPTSVAKPKPTTKPKVKTASAEARLRRQFDSIKDENKPDQVKTLLKFGLSKKEIRALQYEKNRVEKILELMPKNK